jgi:hypothetical protein
MERHPLDGARHKIRRGRERLSELHHAERLLNDPDEERMVIDYDPEQGCHIASLVLRELPPVDLSLTVGECFHHLRGALEYVIWQLALKKKGREPSRKEAQKISFPISDKPEWFSGAPVLPHIAQDAVKELALHQPYAPSLGAGHDPALLAPLREFSNQDKHRLILISTHAMNPATADVRWVNPLATDVRPESIEYEEGPVEPPFPIKMPIERMFTEPPEVTMDTQFEIKKQPESRIFFEGAGERLHLRKLDALARCIELIVDRFDRFV